MIAVAVFLLIVTVLFAGLLPLAIPLGLAAGGVLQTGQTVPARWWLAMLVAVVLFLLLSWRMRRQARLWWLAILMAGALSTVALFCWRATRDLPDMPHSGAAASAAAPRVGLVTGLPLFWYPDRRLDEYVATGDGRSPLVDHLHARAVDHIDAATLRGLDALVLAQPRLLQPTELVALDGWIRQGGRAVIFADPLLMWPSALPLGDPRRAPLTSLLDPLLLHWGLRLEPVARGGDGIDRRVLAGGHVLIMAGASRFAPQGRTPCTFAERGLMALCPIGKGKVRLVADADLLDDRLWLADPRWADRPEAYAADIVPLLESWVSDPLAVPGTPPVRRVPNDAALISAFRWGLVAALFWAGLGGLGYGRFFAAKPPDKGSSAEVRQEGEGADFQRKGTKIS